MNLEFRPATPDDAEACGRIIYEAFLSIADRHRFRPDFPSIDFSTQFVHNFIRNPSFYGVVAESDGRIVGSNFLSELNSIRGVGPITVDTGIQGQKIGRRLMEAVIERGRDAAGIRLVQDAFNVTSLSLYASLGFDVKEPLVLIEGSVRGDIPSGFEVRTLQDEDRDACTELCTRVHGFDRAQEIEFTRKVFTPFVALRDGRVTAYTTAPNFWPLNHAVAETEEDMQALLAGAATATAEPLSFILPTRQAELFRWCLSKGMRVVKPLTLMSMGQYQEPRGSYLPSVMY